MNNDPTHRAAELLKLLSHPGRLAIIIVLHEQGPLNVSTLQNKLGMEQSLMSHHLIKMRDLGLLLSRRQGKEVCYELSDPTITRIVDILLGESSATGLEV